MTELKKHILLPNGLRRPKGLECAYNLVSIAGFSTLDLTEFNFPVLHSNNFSSLSS